MFSTKSLDISSLALEKYWPLIFSVFISATTFLFRHEICSSVSNGSLNMGNLYNAVLSWASIQVGFSFGVYGFVLGKNQGFVEAIRNTQAMARLIIYVKRANYGGFILTFTSLPLAVATPKPISPNSVEFYAVLIWFSLFVWTFFAFLRIAFNFGHISAVRDQEPFIGA